MQARYDRIGHGYGVHRHEEPQFARRIHDALGCARTVVNVGAGAGSYEPDDRRVIAVEPSRVMIAQRPQGPAVVVRALAHALPLADDSVDAAMAIVTLHHWDQGQRAGVLELRRVARGPVVIVTYDPVVSGQMWLTAEYLPEVAALDQRIFPPPERIADWLGPDSRIETLPIPADTPDRMLGAFWAHPEWVLDEARRNATSGFARQTPAVVERAVSGVRRHLQSGRWDARHGALRELEAFDAGLRLIVSTAKR